jgi:predicted nucleic acid-binding protein
MKAIADTGFLVAFGNRTDNYHGWALQLARQVVEPLLTCEAVLAEAAFHLGDSSLVLDFVRSGLVQPAFALDEHIPRMAELAHRDQDRRPDLADLCLIRMSELHPRHPVITTDPAGFRVYRRNQREVIPIIHPPAKILNPLLTGSYL